MDRRIAKLDKMSADIRSEESSTTGPAHTRPTTHRYGLQTDRRNRRENTAVQNRSHAKRRKTTRAKLVARGLNAVLKEEEAE